MARNPANEIAIDNPQAKAAFIAWWATMMAQGYQYGFEALCNVWVGFEGGRSDLARKVLEVVEGADTTYFDGDGWRELDPRGVATITTALRELFAKEGIDVEG